MAIIGPGIQIFTGANPGGGGGILTADNGLHLSTPTNVQLGDPLLQNTQIDSQGNDFHIFRLNFDNSEISLDLQGDDRFSFNGFDTGQFQAFNGIILNDFFASGMTATLNTIDASGNDRSIFRTYGRGTQVFAEMAIDNLLQGGIDKFIRMATNNSLYQGIVVEDNVDGTGLIGIRLFPKFDPKQYIQLQDLLTSPLNGPVVSSTSNNSSLVVPLATTQSGNQLVRVNLSLLFDNFVAGSTLTVSITYTDPLGLARSVSVGVVNSVVPSAFQPVVVASSQFSDVDLNVVAVLIGGATYNAYGSVDILGSIP